MCVSSVYESFLSVWFLHEVGIAHSHVRRYRQKDDETAQMYNDSSGLTSVHYFELKGPWALEPLSHLSLAPAWKSKRLPDFQVWKSILALFSLQIKLFFSAVLWCLVQFFVWVTSSFACTSSFFTDHEFWVTMTNKHTQNPTFLGGSSWIPRRGKLSHHSLKLTPLNSSPFSRFLLNLFQAPKHWPSVTQLKMNTWLLILRLQG